MSRGIRVSGLVREFGPVRAVDAVSFEVEPGSLTVLLGPSGCGKSTILRLVAGLDAADAGRIEIDGRDVTGLDPAHRGVSMVFQSYALFPHLDVRENILFGLKVRRIERAERERRLADAARIVALDGLLGRRPAQLSGGQRQRVALARAIVSQQPVCLMDEPLSNLDAKLRAEMRDEIRDLQRQLGLTMIYVTHDQVEAMSMADRIVLLRDGRIEQAGTPHTLYERPGSTFVARFIGMPPMNVIALDADSEAGGSVRSLLADARVPQSAAAIGVRPEHMVVGDGGLPATVRSADYLGGETVLRARVGTQEIFVKVPGRAAARAGQTLHLGWRPDDAWPFDADGNALSDATAPEPPHDCATRTANPRAAGN
ncbi:MAG: ABC transporter ATP-binding protein [Burkholderiaceae bacterium]|nr:ABC transporter ATP-binding protein [Burkholderiaceae bacterium]